MNLFTRDEKNYLSNALVNGLPKKSKTSVEDLTISIWENIAKLPYPIDTTFNLAGESSIVDVLNKSNSKILEIRIGKSRIEFKFPMHPRDMNREDSVASSFATMAVIDVWEKT